MRKIKIWFSIFLLYEFVMLTILQIPRACFAVFNLNFCGIGFFRYFLMCIMVPTLILLFIWWIPEISRGICKNKCQCENDTYNAQHSILQNIIDSQSVKHLITTGAISLIEKILAKYQETPPTTTEKTRKNKKKH